jgi:drug/metabolite transporter (DMT)-like permease
MKAKHPTEVHKTWVLTVVVILTNVIGNLLLSRGMHQAGAIVSASPLDYIRALANPSAIIGMCVLVSWMITELALLSRADLSFVLPITASAYVLIAACGHFLLHEQISKMQWTGIAAISLGAALVGGTPASTTERTPEGRS